MSEQKKVGLALASGGGRGIAHIGVLQVLTEHNIPIDMVSGSSAGALVAAIYAAGTDPVYVGRIRRDESVENGLNFWCVADNIRKGAATNAVQILQELLKGESL